LPCLINGDDILFRTDRGFYKIWKRWVNHVGFTLSLGKNYVHRRFLTINSQIYHWNEHEQSFTYQGYLNAGLLTGQSKITGRAGAKMAPIWDYYNVTVPNAVNPLRAHRRFLHYHRNVIAEVSGRGNFNLFLPPNRGGLAFLPVGPYRITSFQRRFASFLEREYVAKVAEGEVPRGETIGLVRATRQVSPPSFFHHPRLVRVPYGPLQKNFVIFATRDVKISPLAFEHDSEQVTLKVRHPTRALKRFRLTTVPRMSNEEITSWPWRLAETVEKPKTFWELLGY
jgi:hypothetical protein